LATHQRKRCAHDVKKMPEQKLILPPKRRLHHPMPCLAFTEYKGGIYWPGPVSLPDFLTTCCRPDPNFSPNLHLPSPTSSPRPRPIAIFRAKNQAREQTAIRAPRAPTQEMKADETYCTEAFLFSSLLDARHIHNDHIL
jgi:hypothetical protein